MRKLLAVLALIGLAGCDTPGVAGGPQVVPANWNPPPVTAARAVDLFVAVCGKSLPHFATAPTLMAANGIDLASRIGTATVFSEAENVSFQIQPDMMGEDHCSMVFATSDSQAAITKALSRLGSPKKLYGKLAVGYHGSSGIVPVVLENTPGGFYHLYMIAHP